MDDRYPRRKNLRLHDHDYSENGYYFVTICTTERGADVLCRISSGETVGAAALGGPPAAELTPAGETVKALIEGIDSVYSRISVDTYCIMPDHVHLILVIGDPEENGPPWAAAPTEKGAGEMIPTAVNSLKTLASKRTGRKLWQRGYYEHIIRNEDDLRKTREYIRNNPFRKTL